MFRKVKILVNYHAQQLKCIGDFYMSNIIIYINILLSCHLDVLHLNNHYIPWNRFHYPQCSLEKGFSQMDLF